MGKRCLKRIRSATVSGFLLVLATGAVQAEQAQPGPSTAPTGKPDLTCRVSAFVDSLQGAPIVDGQTINIVGGTRKVVYIIYAKNAGAGRAPSSVTWDLQSIRKGSERVSEGSTRRVVPTLSPGEEVALPLSDITFRPGHTILLKGTMDGPGEVSESKEDNNECTISFTGKRVSVDKPVSKANPG